MKFMLNAAVTLLIAAMGAALAVTYQNDIALFLGKSPVAIKTQLSIWYPYPGTKCPANSAVTTCTGDDEYTSPKVMKIKVTNRSGKALDTIIITTDGIASKFDAYSPTLSNNGNRPYQNTNRAVFGRLDPAETAYIYVWADYLLSNSYSADSLYLTTDYGRFKLPINARFDDIDMFPWVDTETALYIILGITVIALLLFLIVALAYENFSKCLLSDESYYLSEAVRYRLLGKKFAIGTIPLKVQEEMKKINK